jgi:ribosome-associated toxin RatA of RatAB toxin-antitoxin module
MPSARKSIEMNAGPAAVMAVLTDFAAYPDFLPEIRSVDILSASADQWEVRFHAHVIRPLQYTLRLQREGDTRLAWTMLDGIFTSNDGAWELEQLTPDGEGAPRTCATYVIDLVLGVFVPQALVNSLVGESLPATLARFEERVERG